LTTPIWLSSPTQLWLSQLIILIIFFSFRLQVPLISIFFLFKQLITLVFWPNWPFLRLIGAVSQLTSDSLPRFFIFISILHDLLQFIFFQSIIGSLLEHFLPFLLPLSPFLLEFDKIRFY